MRSRSRRRQRERQRLAVRPGSVERQDVDAAVVVGDAIHLPIEIGRGASGAGYIPDVGTWTYWRPGRSEVVETGLVAGHDVGLATHFHAEHQLTLVVSDRRRFVIGDREVQISRGRCGWIEAGVPHQSQREASGVVCVNVY